MSNLYKLPTRDGDGNVHVVVETPRGSAVKLEYDPELRAMTLSRALVIGLSYPHDWGFVPGTRADDGDPLDALVLSDCGTAAGVVLKCKPIGVIRVSQKKSSGGREQNDRVLVVPINAPRADGLCDPRDLPERTRKELEQFFLDVDDLTDKDARIEGWDGPKAAQQAIDEAAERAHGAKKSA